MAIFKNAPGMNVLVKAAYLCDALFSTGLFRYFSPD